LFGVVLGACNNDKSLFIQGFMGGISFKHHHKGFASHLITLEDKVEEDLTLIEDLPEPKIIRPNNIDIYFILLDLRNSDVKLKHEISYFLKQIKQQGNPEALRIILGNRFDTTLYDAQYDHLLRLVCSNMEGLSKEKQRIYFLDLEINFNVEEIIKRSITALLMLKKGKKDGHTALEDKGAKLIARFKSFIEKTIIELEVDNKSFNLFKSSGVNPKILLLEDFKEYVTYPISKSINTFLDHYPAPTVDKVTWVKETLKKLHQQFAEDETTKVQVGWKPSYY